MIACGNEGRAVDQAVNRDCSAAGIGNSEIARRAGDSGRTCAVGGDRAASKQAGDGVQPCTIISDREAAHRADQCNSASTGASGGNGAAVSNTGHMGRQSLVVDDCHTANRSLQGINAPDCRRQSVKEIVVYQSTGYISSRHTYGKRRAADRRISAKGAGAGIKIQP